MEKTPQGQVADNTRAPAAMLVGLLLVLSLALLYPAVAFPLHATGVAAICLGLFFISCLAMARSEMRFGSPIRTRIGVAFSIVAVLWAGIWFWRLSASPVPVEGYFAAVTVLTSVLSFFVVLFSMTNSEQREGAMPVTRVCLLWLSIILSLQSMFAIYQVHGPAGMPQTFATLERAILEELPETDPAREGLLHALRERRAAGTIGAPNIFASFSAAGLALAMGLLFGTRDRRVQVFSTISILVLLWGLILSGSRGGILAAGAGAGIFLFLLLSWRMSRSAMVKSFGAVSIVAFVAAVTLAAIIVTLDQDSRWLNVSGLKQRVFYWISGGEMWAESPIFGRGPGAFATLYPKFRMAGANETQRAHSFIIEYGVSTGLAGILCFFVLITLAIPAGIQSLLRFRETAARESYIELAAVIGAVVALLIHGVLEYTFEFREAAILFMILLGILVGNWECVRPADSSILKSDKYAYAGFALAAIAAVLIWQFQLTPVRAELARREAENLFSAGEPPQIVFASLDQAIELEPGNPDNLDLRAYMRQQYRIDGAEKDIEQAIALNPHSARLRERLALLLADQRRFTEAVRIQEAALELHPLDARHWMTLSEIQLRAGDRKAAIAAFEKTYDLLLITDAEQAHRRRLAGALGVTIPSPVTE